MSFILKLRFLSSASVGNFQNQNINQLNKFIVDIGMLLNLDKISKTYTYFSPWNFK